MLTFAVHQRYFNGAEFHTYLSWIFILKKGANSLDQWQCLEKFSGRNSNGKGVKLIKTLKSENVHFCRLLFSCMYVYPCIIEGQVLFKTPKSSRTELTIRVDLEIVQKIMQIMDLQLIFVIFHFGANDKVFIGLY